MHQHHRRRASLTGSGVSWPAWIARVSMWSLELLMVLGRFMDSVQDIEEVGECYNISGDYDFLMKVYVSSMKEYQRFVLRIMGDLDCIGGLNSFFVMGEVKNNFGIPVRPSR